MVEVGPAVPEVYLPDKVKEAMVLLAVPLMVTERVEVLSIIQKLVRHPVAAQHPTTAGPTTQNCTPAPIRAPGEAGGPQPTRWGITTRCDDLRELPRTRNNLDVAP